ncbi:alpha/beta fold hydrolase [Musicola paradisiaca]|uniref:AB hydrolase-1 domain-containing protein n=1 Tax=Musicola paradisiaca (strain Ech703) TaxID=579405 RepID=C6C6J3_MUSP7|nr:alpha/beta hydrolase [Musicola paradisiaca]ACS83912.1 conserved hypothetical protein [Musicola paradisiaca Ech703]
MLLYDLCYPLLWLFAQVHYSYYRVLVWLKRRPSLLLRIKIKPDTHYQQVCHRLRMADLWLLQRFSQRLAAGYLLRLFESTRYFSYKQMDRDYLAAFDQEELLFQRRRVCVFRWFPARGAPLRNVLLVHGWEGRGIMFRPLCEALKAQGFGIVMPDLPAHGVSEGDRVSNYELAELVLMLGKQYGPFDAVIGHSSGGLISALAMVQGLAAERLVLLASPDNLGAMIDRFLAGTGVAPALAVPMKALYAQRFGFHPDNVGPEIYRSLFCPALICHDLQDARVAPQTAQTLHGALRCSELFYTRGLGHLGILRSPLVHRRILDFLAVTPPGQLAIF